MTPDRTGPPSVAVVIPALNAAGGLARAVASVQAQSYDHIHSIAIAVGPSTDSTADIAHALSVADRRIMVVANPTGRTPNGLNAAIDATTSDVVVRVDAHSVLPPDYVRDAVETLQEHDASNVGAIQHAVGDTPFEHALAAATTSRFGMGDGGYRTSAGVARRSDTGYLGVFARQSLDAVGGYDEAFTRNQDYELNVRLRDQRGGVWLDPRLVVDYRPRPSLSALARQYWQYGWWRVHTVRKHRGSLRWRQLAPPVLIIGLGVSVVLAVVGRVGTAVVVPTSYGAAVVAASVAAPGPLRPAERARLLAIFPTMHLAWGAGFLASGAVGLLRRGRS